MRPTDNPNCFENTLWCPNCNKMVNERHIVCQFCMGRPLPARVVTEEDTEGAQGSMTQHWIPICFDRDGKTLAWVCSHCCLIRQLRRSA